MIIAMDLMDQLEEFGFLVLGPCGSVKDALNIVERKRIDAAILDVNLGTETSEAIAIALRKLNVPFVIASGYCREQYSKAYGNAPAVPKPVQTDKLVRVLSACL